jgi:hypothetical protein
MIDRLLRLRPPRGTAAPVLVSVVFCWIVAAMLAVLIVASSAIGIYEAVLVAELIAFVIVALTILALRRRPALTDGERRVKRRHRERRGF